MKLMTLIGPATYFSPETQFAAGKVCNLAARSGFHLATADTVGLGEAVVNGWLEMGLAERLIIFTTLSIDGNGATFTTAPGLAKKAQKAGARVEWFSGLPDASLQERELPRTVGLTSVCAPGGGVSERSSVVVVYDYGVPQEDSPLQAIKNLEIEIFGRFIALPVNKGRASHLPIIGNGRWQTIPNASPGSIWSSGMMWQAKGL